MRLKQYIQKSGHCSLKQASRLIENGFVYVNNIQANHTTVVNAGQDQVLVEGKQLRLELSEKNQNSEDFIYLIYNKPVGIDCNLKVADPDSLYHYLPVFASGDEMVYESNATK